MKVTAIIETLKPVYALIDLEVDDPVDAVELAKTKSAELDIDNFVDETELPFTLAEDEPDPDAPQKHTRVVSVIDPTTLKTYWSLGGMESLLWRMAHEDEGDDDED